MAESSESNQEDGGGGGSWWGGWLQAAKEKSMSAIEMIKKDLEEFSNTLQQDTGEAVAKTSESLRETLKTENTEAAKGKLKQGLSSFLEGLSKLLVVEAEDKNAPVIQRQTTDPIFDRAKARLHAIQVDPSTYCNKPTGTVERYEEWLKTFDINSKKGEISELLVSQIEVRGLYTRLVPSEIAHADFWKRYFYKVHQLQLDEARKLALMKRAEQPEKKEDSIDWDDLDSSCDEDEEDKKANKVQSSIKKTVTPAQTNLTKTVTKDQEITTKSDPSKTVTKDQDITTKSDPSKTVTKDQEITTTGKSDPSKTVTKDQEITTKSDPSIDSTVTGSKHCTTDASNESEIESKSQDKDTDSKSAAKTSTSDKTSCDGKPTVCDQEKLDSKVLGNQAISPQDMSNENIPEDKRKGELRTESEDSAKITETEEDQCKNTDKDKSVLQESENKTSDAKSDETDIDSKSKCKDEDDLHIEEIRTKEKGDTVVVNPDRDSPSTESTKGSADDDWERDFDVELTEEDLKAADEIAKKLNISSTDYTKLSAELEDDWESWE